MTKKKEDTDTRVDERTDSPLPVTTAGENEPTPATVSDDQVSNEPEPRLVKPPLNFSPPHPPNCQCSSCDDLRVAIDLYRTRR